jgi:hypothetical protein
VALSALSAHITYAFDGSTAGVGAAKPAGVDLHGGIPASSLLVAAVGIDATLLAQPPAASAASRNPQTDHADPPPLPALSLAAAAAWFAAAPGLAAGAPAVEIATCTQVRAAWMQQRHVQPPMPSAVGCVLTRRLDLRPAGPRAGMVFGFRFAREYSLTAPAAVPHTAISLACSDASLVLAPESLGLLADLFAAIGVAPAVISQPPYYLSQTPALDSEVCVAYTLNTHVPWMSCASLPSALSRAPRSL